MTAGRRTAPAALLLCAIVAGCGASAAQESVRTPPPARTADGGLVSVRITRVDGYQLDFGPTSRVPRSVTFEGQVANLPLAAGVWLAARSAADGAGDSWHVLSPSARVEEQGRWLAHVDLPCDGLQSADTCEVFAFVSLDRFEEKSYGRDDLQRHAFAWSDPATIRMQISAASPPPVAIDAVNGAPITIGQPVASPSTFAVAGSGRGPAGQPVWVIGRCPPDDDWSVLGHARVDVQGAWQAGGLELPAPVSPAARACTIEASIAAGAPAGSRLSETALAAWTSGRSTPVGLIRHPYFVAFVSLMLPDGQVVHYPRTTEPSVPVVIADGLDAIEGASDPLPEGVRLWLLLRCRECSSWLAFGPARAMDGVRHVFPSPLLAYPARPAVRRYSAMIVAARGELEGRAFSDAGMAEISLGSSASIPIEHAAVRRPPPAHVACEPGGDPAGGAANDAVIDLDCRATLPSRDMSVYVGRVDPASAQWVFTRATANRGSHRLVMPLARARADSTGASEAVLVPVVGASLPIGRALEQEWWSEMVVAIGDTTRIRLPPEPWLRRVASALTTVWRRFLPSPLPGRFSEEDDVTTLPLSSWLTALLVAAALAGGLRFLWKQSTAARAVVNAWLDTRSARCGRSGKGSRYGDVLAAMTDASIFRIRQKGEGAILRLEGQLDAIEHRLAAFHQPEFDRLQRRTGRHAPSAPLTPMQHRLLLLVLTVGESSFNLAVFYVFREPAIHTLLMALAVAVAIPICAFSVGLWIRRWSQPWIAVVAKLALTLSVLGATLVGLNRVRMAHLASVAPEFVRDHPDLSTAFLSFNALIFLASAMVAYWGHDVEENFAEAHHDVQRLSARASALRGAVQAAKAEMQSAIDAERERGRYYLALYNAVVTRQGGCGVVPASDVRPAA